VTDWLDIGLWIVQGVLALIFLLAGSMHALRYEASKKNLPWVKDLPRGIVVFDGVMEIVGGLGVVLPRLMGILPWLTPLAATGLAVIMLSAMALHARRKEYPAIGMTGLLFVLAVIVAYGRWFLIA
jgi:uncharacterized membrane protein